MRRPPNQQSVLKILENLNGLDPLKELFWNELNYERVNEPISRRDWNETAAKSLADDPLVFADGGESSDFKIIVARLDSDHVRLGLQRPVINRLLRDFPYALFVFSNRDRNAWHFVNVKYDDDPKRRQLFRRISVAPDDRLRTASERMAMLDLESIGAQASPLIIQDRHDEAFDVEKVTKKFFEDFSDIFEVVAKDIRKHNDWEDDIAEKETQTLLNRLLFLYFIQRKGWLNRERDYLVKRFNEQFRRDRDDFTYYSRFLFPLFMRLSTEMDEPASFLGDGPFLNGGLFDDEYGGQQRQDKLLRRTRMKVSNRVFARVFDDVLEKYNFTVREDTPLNQDVSIDPEMLGKIFESLVLQLEQSDTGGKTSRHDTGSYYTPRPIVHYLCREALRVCLESKGEDRRRNIAKLLAIDASDGIDADGRAVLDECLSPEQAKALRDDLDNLRACDQAVGSGAFPLGLLHELVNLSRLCEARSRGRDPVEVDVDWLYDTKNKFIERVIYGVDIQERAVEICKLRLWLSLMVDLDIGVDVDDCSASAFRTALKRKVTPLPNLDYKIRRADSLIEAKQEFYRAKKLEEKRKWRFKIFDATAELGQHEIAWEKNRLGELIADERHSARLSELDRAMRELGNMREQIKAANKLKAHQQDDALERFSKRFDDPDKPTFVWQLDFAEVFHRNKRNVASDDLISQDHPDGEQSTGFEIVVANPPYGIIFDLHGKEYLEARFPTFKRNNDKYVAFTQLGLELLQKGGALAYIMPNTFLLGPYFNKLKSYILENASVLQIVDFGTNQVFADPNVFTALLFLQKGAGAEACSNVVTQFARINDITVFPADVSLAPIRQEQLAELRWMPGDDLLIRLKKSGLTIGDVALVKDVGLNYWTEGRGKKRGGSIADRVLYEGPRKNKADQPYLKGRDIDKYRHDFANRWLRHDWQLLLNSNDTFRFSEDILRQEKILYRQTADRIVATMDTSGILVDKTIHVIVLKAEWHKKVLLPFLLGVIDSELFSYLYRAAASEEGRTFAQVKTFRIRELPLIIPELAEQNAIVDLVERAISAKRKKLNTDTSALEAKINERVARLYGLTRDEQKLIAKSGSQ
jgi:type I restriction-modification system DNA methylase subunit